ncbi:hypothetical protein [Neolewinella persica]|uniref:hypothetical protein n=1 Tax=Neolewinella persica TaxID=70998 RepID=UPI00036A8C04|nr:hypothetical protein [Neolewinella persica]
MTYLNRYLLILFTLLTVFTACEKGNISAPQDPDPVLNPERINFQEPVVGQFNTFEVFSYECGQASTNEVWELDLTITASDENAIEFTESYENGEDFVFEAQRKGDFLIINAEDRQRTRLFFFYGSDTLRLQAAPVAELSYSDCVFYENGEKFTGDFVASMPTFTIEGRSFLNQKVVSCVPVVLDLDGYLFYDQHGLTASITTSTSGFGGEETTFTNVFLLKE